MWIVQLYIYMKNWCIDNVYSDANANIPHINIKMLTMSGFIGD